MNATIITLNNKDYIVSAALEVDGNKYLLLSNENDLDDICIRKVIKNHTNEEILVKLENTEEFNKVLTKLNILNREGIHE